ncbi:MAG: hypothetical protein V2B18_17065, partial [Pseudomonadota bacterium]
DIYEKTYETRASIVNKGKEYIQDVLAFQGAKMGDTHIKPDDIKVRGLDLAVPDHATKDQLEALQQLVEEGKEVGVKVRIITVL